MNESQPSQYGHTTLARDSADAAQWIVQHAAEHGFTLDASQLNAVAHLERLYEDLIGLEKLESLLVRLLARKRVVKGLYLWGGVGRGKSFLMDSFFNCAPVARKRRIHFHRFMQEVHQRMNALTGQAEPLASVARDLAKDTRLLCLDEFHITDITDAMLMRKLLEGLMEQGVVVLTTSNFEPDALYLHGLQRNQFMPAIDLIKQNFDIVNVDDGVDYRLRELEKDGVYHTGADADERMTKEFIAIARHDASDETALEIEGRPVPVRRHARDVVWFEFGALCDGPRGKPDYIELSKRYHTVMVSNVPRFGGGMADKLRRFVWMIDEFYDRRVKLILSADVPADELILDADAADAFQANLNASLKDRLVSRLTEMQTHDYLAQPHLP
ncbi:MAG: cell division protein ZapE [Burkholderiales bacterium]